MARKIESGLVVIFGASGDLTQRKLMPALYRLFRQHLLGKRTHIVGVARTHYAQNSFRELIGDALKSKYPDEASSIDHFVAQIHYFAIADYENDCYQPLKDYLLALQQQYELKDNILFYLATPPNLYYIIPEKLANLGLNHQDKGYRRLIIEKPFGNDEPSAKHLNTHLLSYYDESQLLRIDHYLGKETVQNLLVLRFANSIFEPLWNAQHIENVQIYANESIGVGSRAGYYDQNGALKDMVQNHLLQLLCMVAMEPPAKIDAYSIRNEVLKVLQSIRRFKSAQMIKENVVLGQYTEGCIDGVIKNNYRDAKGVDPESMTATYAGIRFYVDNWRWNGVPFYVRTGKRLNQRVSEIVINFKSSPHPFFSQVQKITKYRNQLVIRIQPDEGIKLTYAVKEPGAGFKTHEVDMGFFYSQFAQQELPSAYERLLLDALLGDNTLFARNDAVEACWNIVDPIIAYAKKSPQKITHFYPSGSNGPKVSDDMLAKSGHVWRNPSSIFKNKS